MKTIIIYRQKSGENAFEEFVKNELSNELPAGQIFVIKDPESSEDLAAKLRNIDIGVEEKVRVHVATHGTKVEDEALMALFSGGALSKVSDVVDFLNKNLKRPITEISLEACNIGYGADGLHDEGGHRVRLQNALKPNQLLILGGDADLTTSINFAGNDLRLKSFVEAKEESLLGNFILNSPEALRAVAKTADGELRVFSHELYGHKNREGLEEYLAQQVAAANAFEREVTGKSSANNPRPEAFGQTQLDRYFEAGIFLEWHKASDSEDELKKMIEERVDPDVTDFKGNNIFSNLLTAGRLNAIKELLPRSKEFKIDDKGLGGNTLLHLACLGTDYEAQEFLLKDLHANPNIQGQKGWTPLMNAALRGLEKSVDLLLSHGANVSIQDTAGDTAAFLAISKKHFGVAEKIIANMTSDSIDLRASGGWTLLMMAADAGNLDLTRAVLERGANLHNKDSREQTALMLAAYSGTKEVMGLLIERGANTSDKDGLGRTALMLAASAGNIDCVRALFENNKDSLEVNALDSLGLTPLRLAVRGANDERVQGRYVEVVQYLLEHGAVEGVEGETKLTPKDHKKRFENPEMVAAFEGAKNARKAVPPIERMGLPDGLWTSYGKDGDHGNLRGGYEVEEGSSSPLSSYRSKPTNLPTGLDTKQIDLGLASTDSSKPASLFTSKIDPKTKNLRGNPNIEFNPTEAKTLAGGAIVAVALVGVLYKSFKGIFSKSAPKNKSGERGL